MTWCEKLLARETIKKMELKECLKLSNDKMKELNGSKFPLVFPETKSNLIDYWEAIN